MTKGRIGWNCCCARFNPCVRLEIISSKRSGGLLLPHGEVIWTEHPESYGNKAGRRTRWSGDDSEVRDRISQGWIGKKVNRRETSRC